MSAPAPIEEPPPPGGPPIGSGPPPSTGGSSQGACFAKITDRNCTYNTATRRYDLRIAAMWDNGTHAHWEIDNGGESKMIYTKNFTHTEPLSAPGMKSVELLVHNVNNSLLCKDSTEVYCGPGSATGKDIDMIIDVKDVVKTGLIDVRVIVAPYININGLRLLSYVESPLNVTNVRMEGNTSLSSISVPARVAEDKSYTVHTASTNLLAGKNVSLLYKVRIDNPGEYKLMAVANYSGTSQRVTKTLKATNCPQAFPVLAVSPSGLCFEYATPCDKPEGWTIVEKCPDATQPEESNPWPLVILIIIVVVAALLIFKNRERLRGISLRRKPKEELPRFEEE